MKKKIVILFVLILVAALPVGLLACDFGINPNREQLIGVWTLTSVHSRGSFGERVIRPGDWEWSDFRGHIAFNEDGTFEDLFGFNIESGTWSVSGRNLTLNISQSNNFWARSEIYRFTVGIDTFSKSQSAAGESVTFYYSRGEAADSLRLSAPVLRIQHLGTDTALVWEHIEDASYFEVQYRRAGQTEFEQSWNIWNNRARLADNFDFLPGENVIRIRAVADRWSGFIDSEFAYYDIYVRHDVRLSTPIIGYGWSYDVLTWNTVAGAVRHIACFRMPGGDFVHDEGGWGNSMRLNLRMMENGAYSVRVRAIGAGMFEDGVLLIPVSPNAYYHFDFVRRYAQIPVLGVTVGDGRITWEVDNNFHSFNSYLRVAGDTRLMPWLFGGGSSVWFSHRLDFRPGINLVRIQIIPSSGSYSFRDGVFTIYSASDFIDVYLNLDNDLNLIDYEVVVLRG